MRSRGSQGARGSFRSGGREMEKPHVKLVLTLLSVLSLRQQAGQQRGGRKWRNRTSELLQGAWRRPCPACLWYRWEIRDQRAGPAQVPCRSVAEPCSEQQAKGFKHLYKTQTPLRGHVHAAWVSGLVSPPPSSLPALSQHPASFFPALFKVLSGKPICLVLPLILFSSCPRRQAPCSQEWVCFAHG